MSTAGTPAARAATRPRGAMSHSTRVHAALRSNAARVVTKAPSHGKKLSRRRTVAGRSSCNDVVCTTPMSVQTCIVTHIPHQRVLEKPAWHLGKNVKLDGRVDLLECHHHRSRPCCMTKAMRRDKVRNAHTLLSQDQHCTGRADHCSLASVVGKARARVKDNDEVLGLTYPELSGGIRIANTRLASHLA